MQIAILVAGALAVSVSATAYVVWRLTRERWE